MSNADQFGYKEGWIQSLLRSSRLRMNEDPLNLADPLLTPQDLEIYEVPTPGNAASIRELGAGAVENTLSDLHKRKHHLEDIIKMFNKELEDTNICIKAFKAADDVYKTREDMKAISKTKTKDNLSIKVEGIKDVKANTEAD